MFLIFLNYNINDNNFILLYLDFKKHKKLLFFFYIKKLN